MCSSQWIITSVQLLSRVWLFATPWTATMPGFPVHHQLPELAQTHVCWVGDAMQPPHPLSPPSPPAFKLSQHQGLFQGVSSLHQVAKVLEFQLQHQPFQRIFRIDFFTLKYWYCTTQSKVQWNTIIMHLDYISCW